MEVTSDNAGIAPQRQLFYVSNLAVMIQQLPDDKHRLFERISPKKSWEGSIGGGVFSIIAAIVIAHYFPFMSISIWIGLALTVVIFGTLGDLTESLLKRTIGIKDSGNILPGHGGMLDRFDSTLMAVPAAVVYLYIISFIE
jgi:phosphatidate cytidylyltransferase